MMKLLLTDQVEEYQLTRKRGIKEEDHLKSAQVKMAQVREENTRLKSTLSQIMKDYHSLQTHFQEIVQQDQPGPRSTDSSSALKNASNNNESDEFVSLSLGRFSGDVVKRPDQIIKKIGSSSSNNQIKDQNDMRFGGLELGLDSRFDSCHTPTENISHEPKEEENSESHRSPKNARSNNGDDIDEVLEQNPLKKARVSVRAICDSQTMNDGCHWRKYGQKTSKGNPCPRAYYRCTVSPSCPVRKQVQRCAEDMSILTTTYEGNHNHLLPASAASVASATSAAVAMLKCGSTATSPPRHGISASSYPLLGFNFPSSNTLSTSACYPRASISTLQSHPTVILDLTTPNHTSPNIKSSSSFLSGFSLQSAWENRIQTSRQEKEIISGDPTFQTALAAAITSMVGGENLDQERNSGKAWNMKWADESINFSQPSVYSGFNRW